ncbi:zinc finger CCCH domain-containing protein 11A [Oxyura jamaicensis]|uniref:zinc finger CCCH domain-containing protein 11A n=1 Tax=Oxyura jamaicensis TaxID=8884 RepID=UPI0015A5CC06|nr:zinc finger CCCH domain-containing protein 11A [Oxyura jamaicensis]XP_035202848.1 zinc finger CCCH domain-containing protein 11A [Oxyura jamaicensis]XP_035202849.1 zinc finger CCCH domain-containing protein 11A [Oxyura jamaicensis]XP_035202850.1 zinc finger CCCH domain-containing protein 11A [Oxyura jamaicensis]XP_035202852.1 zinc finger CCCH domain-containing protein 11A [Oxyura jamaicensis]
MSKQGDDCYFYFYSTCTKGDNCSFRHCEAALGNETVCTLWQEGRCFRNVCRFRHMEIDKKRSEIPCYWENQPVGCQKANCAFHHTKGRYIDGLFLPPSKTTLPSPPESTDDDLKVAQMSLQQNKLSVQSNPSPQLRGVMKVENSENVPSPTHPPVVINAADDDEDDDDQLSEEGEETKTPAQQPATEGHNGLRVISSRKGSATTAKEEGDLNFKIKTLEEIKLQKMKDKTKKDSEVPSRSSLPPVDSMIFPAPEKENARTVVRTVTLSTKQGEDPVAQLDLDENQGKRKASMTEVSTLPAKRSLAERLGKKVEVPGNADKAPKKVQVPKSLKERLGLPSEQTTGKAAKPKGEIHVKTLEEIRRERALQRQETQAKAQAEGHGKTEDPSAGARPAPALRIKTFSEALAEKKNNRLVEENKRAGESHTKIKIQGEPRKLCVSKEPAVKVKLEGEVHVKTLEEIKREKALRMQESARNTPAPPAQPGPAPAGQKSLQITKLTAPDKEEKKIVELNRPFPKPYSVPDVQPPQQSGSHAKFQVKSIDERLCEERQRREQQEKLRKEAADVPSTAGFSAPVPAGTEAAQLQEQEAKTNSTVCAKPSEGKVASPKKKALKRKAPGNYPSAVAAVKPLTAFDPDMMGPPAKRAAMAVPAVAEHVPATRPENPPNRPETCLGGQARSLEHTEFSSSTSASQLGEVRTRRQSSTGNATLSVEEDFENLLWEISGGRLEAELELDAGKDEDDLLLELSKMIDS